MRNEFTDTALILAVAFAFFMVLANTINIRNAAYYEGRYKELLRHTCQAPFTQEKSNDNNHTTED